MVEHVADKWKGCDSQTVKFMAAQFFSHDFMTVKHVAAKTPYLSAHVTASTSLHHKNALLQAAPRGRPRQTKCKLYSLVSTASNGSGTALAPIRVTLEVSAFKEISAARSPDLFRRTAIVAATRAT